MTTRTESLALIASESDKQCAQIIAFLFMRSPQSRSEIAAAIGMRVSSVCGRCNELLAAGKIAVVGRTFDPITQRRVEVLTTT